MTATETRACDPQAIDEIDENIHLPDRHKSAAKSSSSSRSMALMELSRRPVKGDLNEYVDFGSLKKKPKIYGEKERTAAEKKYCFPALSSWLMMDVKRKAMNASAILNEGSYAKSMSVYHLRKHLKVQSCLKIAE